jgi:hypothetical protein
MEKDDAKAQGWGTIIVTLVVVGLVTGLLLGLMNWLFGLSPRVVGGGVGASIGVVGAALIARRRAALARQGNR